MGKKLLSLMTALVMAAALVPAAAAAGDSAGFTDVKAGDWYYDDVAYVVEHDLMIGTSGDAFSPDSTLTRAMILTVLARASGVDTSAGSAWYSAAADWAVSSGISDGANLPAEISREQIAAMLYRYAGIGTDGWGGERIYTFYNDGVAKITDPALDCYFEGTAREGIEALLNAGQVYVNNKAVPASETEADSFVINGFPSLWKTETGWAYSVHKLYSASDLSFEEARMGFLEGISQMRGLTVELYSVGRIEVLIKESTLVNTMTVSGADTKITRYDFALATDEKRPDVNEVVFPTKNVDPNLKAGDIALYWHDGQEWHIQQAVAETGTLVRGEGEAHFVLNGGTHMDALITRYNLQAANRTSQFLSAHEAFGLEGIELTMWSTETGYPIGFTRNGSARAVLELAVINARTIACGYRVSADGSDVLSSEVWVTPEIMDAYLNSIEKAQTVLDSGASTDVDMDMAIYDMYSALGSAGGRRPSGVLGNAKPGSVEVQASLQENGTDAITSTAFDSYFKGTAAEGVEEILNEGKFFVNGFALPAEEGEFHINLGFITLVKTDDGWSSSVHKGDASAPTFEAARLELAEGLTKFAGLYVNLFDDDGDGYADRIEAMVKQSVRVDAITVNGDTVKIDRTNFQVAQKQGAGEINEVEFPAANVDRNLRPGDVGLYWEAPDGFHIDRCASKVGRLTEGKDHGYYVFDGVRYEDIGGVTKYHLAGANRPGQFLEAQRTLGLLGQVDVMAWTVGNYQLAAFSNPDAATALTRGVSTAKEAAGSAVGASADALSALEARIADAGSTGVDLDRAFYQLALAVDGLTAK